MNLIGLFGIVSKFFTNSITPIIILVSTICISIPKIRNFLFNKINEKNLNLYFYSLYIVLFVYISAFLITQVRPIIKSFYFINVLPFGMILIAAILFLPFKSSIFKACFSIFFLVTYFMGNNFFEKNGLMMIRFGDIFQYAYYDSPKYRKEGLKIGIGLHDTDKYRLFYKQYLKGDEIIVMYPFSGHLDNFIDIINESYADVIYTRMGFKTFPVFVEMFKPFGDVSIIRVDKDVLIGRIVKNKQK